MRLLILFLVVATVSGDRIVNTKSGPIKGISVADKKVEAFLGIPYAEPPVGERRFRRPVSKSPWKETYDADELPPACIQFNPGLTYGPSADSKISEDCLYVNLWVPEGGSDHKAVMVFIHGGGLATGSTNMKLYDGAKLSEHGDVIVATINYRVGTLGFYAGITEEYEGSMGMYDQVMALQWIKDNAKHFKGDPENIVLFGESAGSYSVSMHLVSPMSKNLFRRAILQSGSAVHPVFTQDNEFPLTCSHAAASKLGCIEENESLKNNPEKVLECLKKLPAEKFPDADFVILNDCGWIMPPVGNEFLPETPSDLYKKGNFEDKDLLLGVMKNEGSLLMITRKWDVLGIFGEKAESIAFNNTSAEELTRYVTGIKDPTNNFFQSYLNRMKRDTRYSYLDAMKDAVSDYYFVCGATFQANYQSSNGGPVYFYRFDPRPASSPLAEWAGTTHFDEVQYVFGNPMHKEFTKFEEELSKDMMDMWTNFAKTGNPNIPGGTKWPRYTAEDQKYFIIGRSDRIGVKPDNYRCENWKTLFQYDMA